VTWLFHTWHDSFIYNMTPSYLTRLLHMWHDSFARGTPSYEARHSHTWHALLLRDIVMSHNYALKSNFGDVHSTWLLRTSHDSFIRDTTHLYIIHCINMWYGLYTGLRLQAQLRRCLLEFAPRGRGALSHIHINESRTIYIMSHELNIRCGDVYWNSRLEGEIHFLLYT